MLMQHLVPLQHQRAGFQRYAALKTQHYQLDLSRSHDIQSCVSLECKDVPRAAHWASHHGRSSVVSRSTLTCLFSGLTWWCAVLPVHGELELHRLPLLLRVGEHLGHEGSWYAWVCGLCVLSCRDDGRLQHRTQKLTYAVEYMRCCVGVQWMPSNRC
jgi:hypothetical protein